MFDALYVFNTQDNAAVCMDGVCFFSSVLVHAASDSN